MNNTTIYQQLQQHYQKLQTRLAKAKNKGKSQSLQARLLGRIQRCNLQLKQLGAGVAVIAALGVSTPAAAQMYPYVFTERTGAANPFDGIGTTGGFTRGATFVDIDGDNDLDVFVSFYNSVVSVRDLEYLFYENTGTTTSPVFTSRTGTLNPLDAVTARANASFVDIDGDGDKDLFVSDDYYGGGSKVLDYYENTGTATAAQYTLRTGTANPLNDAVTYANGLATPTGATLISSFADIDGDGDMDCFVSPSNRYYGGFPAALNGDRIIYYRNDGTATVPNFQRQTAANNPLNNLAMALPAGQTIVDNIIFMDGERIPRDGDLDVIAFAGNISQGFSVADIYYYENTGTVTSPAFVARTATPLDNIKTELNNGEAFRGMADLTGDDQPEVLDQASQGYKYLENTTPININKLPSMEVLQVYPNPSTGQINLEVPVTGEVRVHNALGQTIHSQQVKEAQTLDFSTLASGVYWLQITTADKEYQQTIYLQQ